jgi:hypothetical protein
MNIPILLQTAVDIFSKAALHYNKQYTLDEDNQYQNLVFFRIDLENSRKVFEELQVSSVPRIYCIPPRDENTPKSALSDYEIDTNFLVSNDLHILLNSIEKLSHVKVCICAILVPYIS